MTDATHILRADAAAVQQAHALTHDAGARLRDDLRVVYVRGDDRASWLNGQVTNDVRNIPPGASVHALAINVRGKIMAELWVYDLGDRLALLVPQSALDGVLASFEHYIIMEDVVLERDEAARVISVQGPKAQSVIDALDDTTLRVVSASELGQAGVFVVTTTARASALLHSLLQHGAHEISELGYELARLRAAQPRFARDYGETHYPQEVGLKSLVSFQKGCYLGQEVVCTLENRGRMHRRLCTLTTADVAASETTAQLEAAPGQVVGELTSRIYDPTTSQVLALGYVKRTHATAGAALRAGACAWVVGRFAGDSE